MKARVIVVEASHRPDMAVRPPGDQDYVYPMTPLDPEVWPGRNRYLVPKGHEVTDIVLEYDQMGCSPVLDTCKDPAALVAIVTEIATPTTWTLTATTGPQTTTVHGRGTQARDIALANAPGTYAWLGGEHQNAVLFRLDDQTVRVIVSNAYDTELTAHWSLEARRDGVCPDPEVPCSVPADVTLTLGQPK